VTRFALKVVGVALAAVIAGGAAWWYAGLRGLNPLVRSGGTYWLSVTKTSPLLTPSMRIALASNLPATPGSLVWQTVDQGFDVADLPVLMGNELVDHVLLARIDPARFRFAVHNSVAGERSVDQWLARTGAALVVNGSYFSRHSEPATPLLSGGSLLGPKVYDARAGVFVSSASAVGVHDLAHQDWRVAFQGATDAMVSYPLLVANGVSRVPQPSRWLATRSFIAQDRAGRILIGTTTDAFFSLDRLARFLLDAPLDLTIALNLDGGPVACQNIALNGYARKTYGRSEAQVDGDDVKLLASARFLPSRFMPPSMPIVLTVSPR